MKIKCRPDDFRVEEITELQCGGGRFALYRLTKQSIGTPEAIDALCRAQKCRRAAVSVGGLKDRHAVTSQHLTIDGGPRRDWRHENLQLVYLGQLDRPFDSQDIAANRFQIVIRDLRSAEADRARDELAVAEKQGIPNYFDDQRFGSLGKSGEFIARPWCQGDFERALWLAIADANEHDTPAIEREKRTIRERWDDWPACRQAAKTPATCWALDHLVTRSQDFRGAFVRIPQHDRRMFLSAFQSYLWNAVLGERLRQIIPENQRFDQTIAGLAMPFPSGELDEATQSAFNSELPLPSAREKIANPELAAIYERVAATAGLQYRELRVKYPRDSFFSRGGRAMTFRPVDGSFETGSDELYEGRRKVELGFTLPRGSYATIAIKQLFPGA